MKKSWAVAAAAATVVAVGAGTTAGAIPKREPEVWTCPGGTTMIVTAGRNGWIDGVKYKAVEFSIDGTFTPTGGTPEPVDEFKQWGGGAGAGTITCTMHVDDISAEGHFVADFTVVAVPA
jgi:hypothetical protein